LATGKSGSFTLTSGKYAVQVNWSETYDPIANTSVVKIDSLKAKSGNWYGVAYYPNGTVKINGSNVVSMNSVMGTHNVYIGSLNTYAHIKPSGGSSTTASSSAIAHESNGTKSVTIEVSLKFYTTSGDYGSGWGVSGSKTIELTSIDRAAPGVSLSVTPVSSSSMTIAATSNVNADIWEYSLDNGSTWTQYSTTAGTTANKTLTGLTSRSYTVKVRARKVSNHVYGTSSAVTGDIVLPTITLTTSSITASSVYISASSNVNCNIWDYSIDDGSTWTRISSTNGTSATKTISGLTPNTEYKIKVRARKTANNLYGTSSRSTIKTLGGTVLNSVNELTIDEAAPVLALNWTVYDASYTHTITIKNGSTTVLTLTGIKGSVGTNNKTHSFTSAQRTTILNAMASLASFTATIVVSTYSGSTKIGTDSSKTVTIKTTAATSAPTHGGFSWLDVDGVTVGVTGSSALCVQHKSSLRITFKGGTAKNGASISSYTVTIGSKTVSSETKTVNFGAVSVAGDVTLTATVKDSRGWTTVQTTTLSVIEFNNVSINSWSTRRVNEVEEMAQLELVGALSPVYVDDVATNTLQSLQYRFKKITDTSWSQYYDVSGVEKEHDRFTVDNDAFATFDPEYSWDLQIRAVDKLSNYTITIVVPKGTPLVAYRSKKVGINNNNPQSALDVNGDIMQNGYGVMGFVGVLDDYKTFDNVKGSGIYWYNSAAALTNAPAAENGFLEVVSYGAITLHRFTGVSGAVKSRILNTRWSAWT